MADDPFDGGGAACWQGVLITPKGEYDVAYAIGERTESAVPRISWTAVDGTHVQASDSMAAHRMWLYREDRFVDSDALLLNAVALHVWEHAR